MFQRDDNGVVVHDLTALGIVAGEPGGGGGVVLNIVQIELNIRRRQIVSIVKLDALAQIQLNMGLIQHLIALRQAGRDLAALALPEDGVVDLPAYVQVIGEAGLPWIQGGLRGDCQSQGLLIAVLRGRVGGAFRSSGASAGRQGQKKQACEQQTKHLSAPELVRAFSAFGAALIADAMGRYGAMTGIVPLCRGRRLAGPALTVRTYRSDNLMLHAGLEMAEAGDILVTDAGGIPNAGLWGGLMTEMALRKSVGGLVIDGAVRDSQELIASGFPVYSRSVSPLGGFKSQGGAVNVPISCGSVPVFPGDIVVGDEDGVVVIPLRDAETVLEKCRRQQRMEEDISQKIKEGAHLFDLFHLGESLEKLGLSLPGEGAE